MLERLPWTFGPPVLAMKEAHAISLPAVNLDAAIYVTKALG